MKIGINFVLDVPQERLKALYAFMATDREGVRDCLNVEAAEYLQEYLHADGRVPSTLIRAWERP